MTKSPQEKAALVELIRAAESNDFGGCGVLIKQLAQAELDRRASEGKTVKPPCTCLHEYDYDCPVHGNAAWDDAFALGSQNRQGWIDVDVELPGSSEPVLVFVDLGNDCDPVISIACRNFHDDGWHILDPGASKENGDDITHWMPLPPPPTVEGV